MEPGRIDREPDRAPARASLRGSTRAVNIVPPREQHRVLVLARLAELLGVDHAARRPEEHVRVGAEVLEHRDLGVELRQRRIGERRVLEALRPDAEDDLADGHRRVERDPVAAELDAAASTRASTRFIAGEPMNAATKRFRGRR